MRADEQERADVQAARRAWTVAQPMMDVEKLVFIDETWISTSMTRQYRHGLRASEVCGIKLADVDLKSGSIPIRRLKGSLHTIQPLYQHRGQPLLDETAALRAWMHKRPADGSAYLFTSQKRGKLGRTQFFRKFQTVAESACLPVEKRHHHVLEHSLASHLIAGNANLALVRQALRHRSINSTMQCVGTSDGQAAEALQKALMGIF